MAEYGDVNEALHIVGDGSEVPNLKRLVADFKPKTQSFSMDSKRVKSLMNSSR